MALTEEGIVHVPGMLSRWVKLPSGARAHYMTSGETGPAVVLCHGGLPGSSSTAGWRFIAPFLGEHGFRVYCPDFPGYGLSDTRPEHWSVQGTKTHQEFLHEFVNALCLDRFHLAGNSMGCRITWGYTLYHPDRVINYVLIAGGVGDLMDDSKIRRTMDLVALNRATFDGTKESMYAMMEPIIYRKDAITDDLLEMRTRAANRNRDSLKAHQQAGDAFRTDPNLKQWASSKGRLDTITIPGLMLWGVDDVLNPVDNAYMHEDVTPNIQYFYPPDCGHQGQTDRPDIFNQVFLEFFRDGKGSRKTADWSGVSKRRPELGSVVEQAEPARA